MKKVLIIGGGILGLSIGRELKRRNYKNITILEKENDIAMHQSGRNSGVMHAGLYYLPKSLKAELSRKGIKMMKTFCNDNQIEWEECGKVVIANDQSQLNQLNKLLKRGKDNKLFGLEKLNEKQILQKEPYVNALEGIFVPEESIVNYKDVAKKYLEEFKANNGILYLGSEVVDIKSEKGGTKKVSLKNGQTFEAEVIIISAGVYTDRISKILDIDISNQQILPFRGEYYLLKKEFNYLVKGLIYPVPNPKLPFLGVHFTKMISGNIEAGPNAVLALAREGYNWKTININEFYESIKYPGLRKFLYKYPLITCGEVTRSLSKELFVKSLRKLIPSIEGKMLIKGNAGIRAQLMNEKGDLVQDFDIRIKDNVVSILNAPSPAATSSLAIAAYVVDYLDL